jgi:hypothetical protein
MSSPFPVLLQSITPRCVKMINTDKSSYRLEVTFVHAKQELQQSICSGQLQQELNPFLPITVEHMSYIS